MKIVRAIGIKQIHVGDVGIDLGNWGARSQKSGSKQSQVFDLQMKGNPCHIIILCEATEMTKRVLMEPPTVIDETPRGSGAPAPSGDFEKEIPLSTMPFLELINAEIFSWQRE